MGEVHALPHVHVHAAALPFQCCAGFRRAACTWAAAAAGKQDREGVDGEGVMRLTACMRIACACCSPATPGQCWIEA